MAKIIIKDLLESNLLKPLNQYSPSQLSEEIKLLHQRIETLKRQYKKMV